MFLVLGAIFFAMQFIGILLLVYPPPVKYLATTFLTFSKAMFQQDQFDDAIMTSAQSTAKVVPQETGDGQRTITHQLSVDPMDDILAKKAPALDQLPANLTWLQMVKTVSFWMLITTFFLNQTMTHYVGSYWKVDMR